MNDDHNQSSLPDRISIVIPIYNENQSIDLLYSKLSDIMKNFQYELIFVDDGSNDGSNEILKRISDSDKNVKLIEFSRNFGQQAAFLAGLRHTSGDAVIMMDGDLQDPPEAIPSFLAKWKEGYEVIYAIRTKRKEHVLKRTAYSVYYKIFNILSEMSLPNDSGDFSLIDRTIVDLLIKTEESSLFLRGLRAWVGFNQIGIPIERQSREYSLPKFTLAKLVKLGTDGIFSFSHKPLYLLSILGILISVISFFSGCVFVIMKIGWGIPLQGWTSLMVSIFFSTGLIILSLGITGIYIGKIFHQIQKRPPYIIKSKNNFD